MASTLPTNEDPSTETAKGAPVQNETLAFDDSRSETTTIDSEADDVSADLSSLTFFTRLYELPIVNDAVSSIYRIAESNRYTSAIIGYAEKVGGLAEKSRPLLKPVEKPIAILDSYATRSLELIEA
ncbi:hypothetical protein GGI06_002744, partial [Coemansia sp. S85]